MITRFRVDLEIFRGPLDLLLYLVRKHELDVIDIPIAPITEQFLEYLAVLEQIDVNAVGDFLDMASTLIEIKSRMVLPGEEEVEDELEDPRQELVRRLLEYKQYRDAASMLEERSREWQRALSAAGQRPAGAARDRPTEQPIQEVELWDLVSAFGRVLKEKHAGDRAGEHPLRRNADPRLHAADRRAAAPRGPRRVHRVLRRGRAQVDAGRHVPGRAGAGAASARRARPSPSCSAKSGWSPATRRCRPNCAVVSDYEHGGAVERLSLSHVDSICVHAAELRANAAHDSCPLSRRARHALQWRLSCSAEPPAPPLRLRASMINNLPVKTLKHGDLTIEGYSRAAVQTYWRFPELKLGFDLGAQPWSFMGTETWFVTHGHLDHIAALPVYVARRRMMKMTPPVIYMPAETIEPMQKILRQFTRLDRGRHAVRAAGRSRRATRSSCRAS